MSSIKRTCFNKDLNTTCLFGCGFGCYCTAPEVFITFTSGCSTYINKNVFKDSGGANNDQC